MPVCNALHISHKHKVTEDNKTCSVLKRSLGATS